MRTLTKRILVFAMSITLCAALLPMTVFAIGKILPDQPVDLTIRFADDNKPIPGSYFRIYRIADADEHAFMTLTEEFETYRSSVSGLSDLDHLTQEQWGVLTSSLKGYVLRDGLTPVAEGRTGGDGTVDFPGLKAGLYLVIGSRAMTYDGYTYTPMPFAVFLPCQDSTGSDWNYEVTAVPKYTKYYTPSEDEDEYISRKVLKEWDDVGYEALRPDEITVQLLRDGAVFDTQTLNNDNNWRYTWDNLNADYEWDVIEQEISGYAVSVTRSGITFTVTNRYIAPIIGTNLPVQKRITGDTPNTGSTFTFVLSACDDSCPMPAGSSGTVKEITITGAGSCEIGEISFTEPGTYVYTIREKDGGIEGYTYDTTVYTVTYTVTEKDGKLSVTETINDDQGNTVSAVEFTNPYKIPGNNLPQTGILWWPVPLLFGAGLVSVMIGIIRRRRCN